MLINIFCLRLRGNNDLGRKSSLPSDDKDIELSKEIDHSISLIESSIKH